MNQGCSPCACGIQSACDAVYPPAYALPGALLLVAILAVLLLLIKKNKIKLKLRTIIAMWLVVAVVFAGLVWLQTDSGADRTTKAAERCRISGDPTCEY